MSEIKLRITLNKGRHGILMNKLARLAEEAEKFLDSFAQDLDLDRDEWVADSFKNGSLTFTANYIGPAEPRQIQRAKKALAKVINPKIKAIDLSGDLSPRTYTQFARLAQPIDADDSIGLAVENENGRFVTKTLTKERAIAIDREMNRTTEEFASFQGSITALFKQGTCWMVDYLTNERIVCMYKPDQYRRIWKLLENPDGIANIEGWAVYKNGVIDCLRIEHIAEAAEYKEGDIDRFFGSAPNFTGGMSTEQYLDEIRGEKAD